RDGRRRARRDAGPARADRRGGRGPAAGGPAGRRVRRHVRPRRPRRVGDRRGRARARVLRPRRPGARGRRRDADGGAGGRRARPEPPVVTLTFAAALGVGALLVACGAFTAAWRREGGPALAALPMLAAGAAVCVAGASRFSAGAADAQTGEELAVLVSVVGLAAA